jgi:membrane-associated phospholipid phosphatase
MLNGTINNNIGINEISVKMGNMIDFMGNYGPLFMIIMALWVLNAAGLQTYVYYFIVGLILNTLLNIILKGIIQQPRPGDMDHPGAFQKRVSNILATRHGLPFNLFGMPSGHAQAVFYVWSFLWATLIMGTGLGPAKGLNGPGWLIKWSIVLIGIIVLIQRVEWEHHTWLQVTVGCIVGGLIGVGAWKLGRQKTKGLSSQRQDDNAHWTLRTGSGMW